MYVSAVCFFQFIMCYGDLCTSDHKDLFHFSTMTYVIALVYHIFTTTLLMDYLDYLSCLKNYYDKSCVSIPIYNKSVTHLHSIQVKHNLGNIILKQIIIRLLTTDR